MPLVPSAFCPPFYLRGGHVQTLYPFLLRAPVPVDYRRERLELPDSDFVDLDWSLAAGPGGARAARVALVVHGLEGHSRRKYVRGMVRALNAAGWDVCAMNHRGCSGEPNRLARTYHSGETGDLHAALVRALGAGGYASAALVGFSMGGNQVAKYLGEEPGRVPPQVRAGVAVSAPLDLAASVRALERGPARVYQAYLMRSLKEKMRAKAAAQPGALAGLPQGPGLDAMRTFREFDDAYTAPLNGFADARDYYARNGAVRVLEGVGLPLLVLCAADDPFLGPECYPRALARASAVLHLETPATGGHVGFAAARSAATYAENRTVEFLGTHC
ncbi:alpha/beta fold hydrolase [Desulfocurvus sp.]|uniref:YheT family hydrolase n=1 Tax=Desulfocurvus sp. TaxID=2871698 RepID=UPI0025BA57B7|nr:alpha/beta fold hydrolase [Desulfocurvus sp.]MCK9239028.1 alpha/beta fold hydrolase [Desulfocurvus sp.]